MRAVLFATTPGAQAQAGDETVAERLTRQFRSHGVNDITVITRHQYRSGLPSGVTIVPSSGVREDLRLLTEVTTQSQEAILLACADTVLADTAVSAVLSDPTQRCGVLVRQAEDNQSLDVPVYRDRGMVLSLATGFHEAPQANAVATGLIKVSSPYVGELRKHLTQLAADGVANLATSANSWTLTLLGLVRGGTKLNAYEVPGLRYGRVAGAAGAQQLLAAINATDEDAVRLKLCVKADDDLFATYSISSYSRKLVTLCAKLKLTPVMVTWGSILLAFVAAGLFAEASRLALIGGALAMYLSFALDCVDGQVARYTHNFSAFGGWLDMIADRGKEYLMYAGLAWGAAEAGHSWAWPLAITAICVQTTRHMTDTWYGTMQDEAVLSKATQPYTTAADRFVPASGLAAQQGSLAVRVGRMLGKLSASFTQQRGSLAYWFKRTIVFPVGERWLVMGLAAAIFDGRIALAALLTWQLVALAYTLAGRGLRSWAAKVPVLARDDKSTHRDDGLFVRVLRETALPVLPVLAVCLVIVAAALIVTVSLPAAGPWPAVAATVLMLAVAFTASSRHDGPLDWLVPAGLRAGEFGLIITCGLASAVPLPLIFGLLGALAIYHYDLAARIDKAASPLNSRTLGLGWDGRCLVLLISLIPGIGTWIFALLTALLVVVFLGGALVGRQLQKSAGAKPSTPVLTGADA